ncbi:MAG: NAD(P)H-hydrate dehydratase, partial [Marinirhabdus sp.]
AVPRISPASQITDPTAFPNAMSGFPFRAAKTETTASGNVVPTETIVAPTITFGIPVRKDKVTAFSTIQSADFPKITAKDIAIDALFGIGLNRPPEGWVKKLVQHINRSSAFTLSIDIPSGLFANKPGTDPTAVVKPNHTLTFQTPKLSFFLPGTGKFVPHFEVIDIGLDQEYLHTTQPLAQLITKAAARNFYKQREKYTHKGTYGHSLIIAGSYGKMGAAVLAARAAARAGSGLVSVFVPQCGYETLQTSFPEAMVFTDAEPGVISKIEFDIKPTSTAIGMGIGTNGLTEKALREFLKKTNYPIVIDADALNIISKKKTLQKLIPKNSILTPHPGELKRLIGPWADDFEKIEKTKKLATALNAIVVVKGADTLTVFNGQLYINASGNPGMATGGTGDALAGVLCGLLAQGYDPLIAAVFGVYLHGSSGNIASQQQGFEAMIASDVIANLGPAFLELFAPNAEERQKKQG